MGGRQFDKIRSETNKSSEFDENRGAKNRPAGPGNGRKILHSVDIREKKSAGMIVQMSRSMFKLNLLQLLKAKAITLADLSDFSLELQEEIKKIWEGQMYV